MVVHIHNVMPASAPATVLVPEQQPPVVHVHNEVQPTAVPVTVHNQVHNDVQPADVTVVSAHPARAVQEVVRDPATDEVVSTVTRYEFDQKDAP